jgi:hypothetical protein
MRWERGAAEVEEGCHRDSVPRLAFKQRCAELAHQRRTGLGRAGDGVAEEAAEVGGDVAGGRGIEGGGGRGWGGVLLLLLLLCV